MYSLRNQESNQNRARQDAYEARIYSSKMTSRMQRLCDATTEASFKAAYDVIRPIAILGTILMGSAIGVGLLADYAHPSRTVENSGEKPSLAKTIAKPQPTLNGQPNLR